MLKYLFQNNGHFQNYGHHLVPCCPDKWGSTALETQLVAKSTANATILLHNKNMPYQGFIWGEGGIFPPRWALAPPYTFGNSQFPPPATFSVCNTAYGIPLQSLFSSPLSSVPTQASLCLPTHSLPGFHFHSDWVIFFFSSSSTLVPSSFPPYVPPSLPPSLPPSPPTP